MNKQEWQKKIKEQTENVGTYRPDFDDVIESLATILEQRDKAFKQFTDTGGNPVVTHTNKAGATNACKNPILVMWSDLNGQALTFWRDLGLTPSGLRKLNEDALKPKKQNTLAMVLKEFEL